MLHRIIRMSLIFRSGILCKLKQYWFTVVWSFLIKPEILNHKHTVAFLGFAETGCWIQLHPTSLKILILEVFDLKFKNLLQMLISQKIASSFSWLQVECCSMCLGTCDLCESWAASATCDFDGKVDDDFWWKSTVWAVGCLSTIQSIQLYFLFPALQCGNMLRTCWHKWYKKLCILHYSSKKRWRSIDHVAGLVPWRVQDNHQYLVVFLFRLLSGRDSPWMSLMNLSLISSAVPDWFPLDEPLSNSRLYLSTEDDEAWLKEQVCYINNWSRCKTNMFPYKPVLE